MVRTLARTACRVCGIRAGVIGVLLITQLLVSEALAEPWARQMAQEIQAETGAPAVAVGWITPQTSGVHTLGMRAAGHSAAAEDSDLWHIGSNTKAMTALLAARLVEAGQIDWTTRVSDVLSDLAPHEGYSNVTLRDLLAHRSGLAANLGRGAARRLSADDIRAARRDYAAAMLAKPPKATGFRYSNAGYVVAAAMMEAVTDTSWETLITQEVFALLGMDSARFGAPGSDLSRPDQPWGHKAAWYGRLRPMPPDANADNPPVLGPAGRIHLSTADHLRFLRVHLQRSPRFLSPQTWNVLQSDVTGQGYGLGWIVQPGVLFHDGSNTFWYQRVVLDVPNQRALILSVNAGRAERAADAMQTQALRFLSR